MDADTAGGSNVPGRVTFVVDSGFYSTHIISGRAYLDDSGPYSVQLQTAGTENFVPAKEMGIVKGNMGSYDDRSVSITLKNMLCIDSRNDWR